MDQVRPPGFIQIDAIIYQPRARRMKQSVMVRECCFDRWTDFRTLLAEQLELPLNYEDVQLFFMKPTPLDTIHDVLESKVFKLEDDSDWNVALKLSKLAEPRKIILFAYIPKVSLLLTLNS